MRITENNTDLVSAYTQWDKYKQDICINTFIDWESTLHR